jgi:hypothetical protein
MLRSIMRCTLASSAFMSASRFSAPCSSRSDRFSALSRERRFRSLSLMLMLEWLAGPFALVVKRERSLRIPDLVRRQVC